MAILAYVGIPGSGKSYEVVSSVILEHFKKGRRIVSNIVGVTQSKLFDYCVSKGANPEELGEFISISDEQCQQADFFPYKGSENSICRAGDLICLDEVWRIFPSEKIHENHRSFLAEHRHFTNPDTGECCDLVVINQSVAQLPRFIKDRIETTYRMSKLSALGMSNRYRVDVFSGAKITKSNRTLQLQRKYNKEIFSLYKSYDGVNGKENTIDGRGNILKSFQFKIMIVLIILLFSSGFHGFNSFFNMGNTDKDKVGVKADSGIENIENLPVEKRVVQTVVNYTPPRISEKWRITGELSKDGESFVILSDTVGRLRFEPRSSFSYSGRMLEGVIDGEVVNYYSGAMQ